MDTLTQLKRVQNKKLSKKPPKKPSKKPSKKCSKSQILRRGYTTKTGKKVSSGCIEATSGSGKKTSIELKKYIQKKESKQKQSRQKFPNEANQECKPGQILREGYYVHTHKSHSKLGKDTNVKSFWVKPGCVDSQLNRNTKGEKKIVLMEKDVLKSYGYTNIEAMSKISRHSALRKAIKNIKPLSIYRRVIAIASLNKNKNEKLYNILREDADWIKTQPEYIQHKKNSKVTFKKLPKSSKKLSKKSSK